MTPEQLASLSPEERRAYEEAQRLLAEGQSQAASLPPPPMPEGAAAERPALPPPPQDTPPQGAEVSERTPPPDDIRPPSQGAGGGGANALPPPISIPERNVPRTGSEAGRKAHAVFGALLSPITGGNTFMRRVAREEAMGDRDYRDDLREYQLRNAQREQQVKEGRMLRPINPELADKWGISPDTTRADFQDMVQGRMGGLIADERRSQYTQDLERMRQEGRGGLEEAKHGYRMEEIAARNRGRRSSGGGGASSLPRDASDALQDLERRYVSGDESVTPSQMQTAYTSAYGPKAANQLMGRANSERGKNLTVLKGDDDAYQKMRQQVAPAQTALKGFRPFVSNPKLGEMLSEIQGSVDRSNLSSESRKMQNELRRLAAGYMSAKGGKSLTEGEQRLYAGVVGNLIDDGFVVEGDDWLSTAMKTAVNAGKKLWGKGQVTTEDLRDFYAMVDDEVRNQVIASASGPRAPRNIWESGYKRPAKQRVLEAWGRANPDQEPPAFVRPGDSPTEWELKFSDGTVKTFRMQ